MLSLVKSVNRITQFHYEFLRFAYFSLTVEDLEKMQQQHPDYRMELVKGNIIIMGPSGYQRTICVDGTLICGFRLRECTALSR
ncbi:MULTISPECIES: hypothetical protein [Nostocales]|uniref:Uncharacterized protein n=1 Tax=Tolypothrix bouteillei VB521301 TaxID=1479485 RepID=A0A0C1QQ62_9CYAN